MAVPSNAGFVSASLNAWARAQLRVTVAVLLVLAVIGGFVFCGLERGAELERIALNKALYRALTESVDFKHCHDPVFKKTLGFCRDHEELEQRLEQFFDRAGNSLVDTRYWTWFGGFFFVMKLASTVGYASQGAPQTDSGQVAAIVFGFLVIPVFGYAIILSAGSLLAAANRIVGRCFWPAHVEEPTTKHLVLLGAMLLMVLWFGGAFVFSLLEGWSYPQSFYFCFMTLSTVGFGKRAPTTLASRAFFPVYIFLALSFLAAFFRQVRKQDVEENMPLVGKVRRKVLGPWACLAWLVVFCILAALLFPLLEREEELNRYRRAQRMYEDLNNLATFDSCDKESVKHMSFCKNAKWFREKLKAFFGPDTPNAREDQKLWTTSGSLLFVLSLASTVGYGAQAPHTLQCKLATIVVGCLVIPLFWTCVWRISSEIGRAAERAYRQATGQPEGDNLEPGVPSLSCLALTLWLVGALVLWSLDQSGTWTYFAALYFCFVTLSSVGFSNVMPHGLLARGITLIYIVFGLGICATLVKRILQQIEEYGERAAHAAEEESKLRKAEHGTIGDHKEVDVTNTPASPESANTQR